MNPIHPSRTPCSLVSTQEQKCNNVNPAMNIQPKLTPPAILMGCRLGYFRDYFVTQCFPPSPEHACVAARA